MASERVKLFSKIEIEIYATAQAAMAIFTDLPGQAMAQRFAFTMPSGATRRTVTSRLPYNTQGHLIQLAVTPTFGVQVAIYRARVWGRELPGGQWDWYPLPVIDTPVEFAPAPLPVPPTSEEWRSLALPVPPTSEEWRSLALAIPPTTEEWSTRKLPIKPTPEIPDWADLEVDK